MKEVRVLVLSGFHANKIGIMDSAGYIRFIDTPEVIHNSEVKWTFYDFRIDDDALKTF